MGALGSGRTRNHPCIDDCLEIDTAWLRKQKILDRPSALVSMEWKKWTETNFSERKEHTYTLSAYYDRRKSQPSLTLRYQVSLAYGDHRPKQERVYKETISLESTPCNYGGVRWWFTAPCCGRRVRVLYINQKCGDLNDMKPQCRACLSLHYASQLSSYTEKHITYEKYLLANWGYAWAQIDYARLEERYFKVTPEWEYIRERSHLKRSLELTTHMIRFHRMLRRGHVRTLRSLKSHEDKAMYLRSLLKDFGTKYIISLVKELHPDAQQALLDYLLSEHDSTLDTDATAAPSVPTVPTAIEQEDPDGTIDRDPTDIVELATLIAYKRQYELNLKSLEKHKPAKAQQAEAEAALLAV